MKYFKAAVISVMVFLTGCSENYNFSGNYGLTMGDECKAEPNESTFITISPAGDSGEDSYTARLSSLMSGGGVFPTDSKPSSLSGDGSLTLNFFKDGKSGMFSSKPAVDMKIRLVGMNDSHILVESWLVTVSDVRDPSKSGSFDYVKDSTIKMLGRETPNKFSQIAGKNGLCLKKEGV